MFSVDVVGQDNFLDMPTDSRELYFQLGMYADDEGFVSPRKVMRLLGASEDTLKVLMGKGFVIPFESGVIVIKDWKQNNYIQSDRFTPTIFQKEKALLAISKDVYILDTQGGREVREESKNSLSLKELDAQLKDKFRSNRA